VIMPELCCIHCDCCLLAWDGDHCRQCGADCYECPLRLEMIDAQRARDQGMSFLLRLLLAIAAALVLYGTVYWIVHGGI